MQWLPGQTMAVNVPVELPGTGLGWGKPNNAWFYCLRSWANPCPRAECLTLFHCRICLLFSLHGNTSRFIEGTLLYQTAADYLTEYKAVSSPTNKGRRCARSPGVSLGSFALEKWGEDPAAEEGAVISTPPPQLEQVFNNSCFQTTS